jgi:hypothetical protein
MCNYIYIEEDKRLQYAMCSDCVFRKKREFSLPVYGTNAYFKGSMGKKNKFLFIS